VSSISVQFLNPWLLFALIPAIALTLFPFFRLPAQHRRTRNRVVSLAIHLLVLTLCVGLLSGVSFSADSVSKKSDVILVADVSASNQTSVEKMNDFIKAVIDGSNGDYNIGVVTFANGQVYAAKLGRDIGRVYGDYVAAAKPDGSATDIASALNYAKSLLANPGEGRIILMTDGRETDGKALAVTKAIAQSGVRIDAVYFSPAKYENEVQIVSVTVPAHVSAGVNIQVTVTMRSAAAGAAVLTLSDNGRQRDERSVTLSGGTDIFVFDYAFDALKLHELYVTIQSAGDAIPQNNGYYSFVNIEVSTNVLILDGTGNEAGKLSALLSEDGGATWPYSLLLDGRTEVSYPGTHVTEDGRIYIVHDKGRYTDKEIVFHVIRPEDIVAGKLVCPDSRLMEIAAKGGGKIVPREELAASFKEMWSKSGMTGSL
jgi:hypothetical protein